jgi:hypothetical protein
MLDVANTIDDTGVCAMCGSSPSEGSYRQMVGRSLVPFCSSACLSAALSAKRVQKWARWLRVTKRLTLAMIVLSAWLVPHERLFRRRAAGVAGVVPDDSVPPAKSSPPPLPPGWFGPEWPPSETSVLAVLGRDAWVHPLAGPSRRMPRTDARVFGAVRPGDRAIECRNGHCGVDLGGEIWGEHVRAAHDGIVDWVQRGPNPDHGGRYVRLSHHDGTVFTQYFHLAAIPRGLERGVPVRGGQVIGLVGDSGVKESKPHLHFAVSVRLSEAGRERYIDPEPLIALWPLRIPVEGSEVGLVTITAQPGMPLGSAARRARARKSGKDAKNTSAPGEAAPADVSDDAAEPAGEPEAREPSVEEE